MDKTKAKLNPKIKIGSCPRKKVEVIAKWILKKKLLRTPKFEQNSEIRASGSFLLINNQLYRSNYTCDRVCKSG